MTVAASNPIVPPLRETPPLQNGDRLTRDEFERRYHLTPKHIKAELVEGMVYMASPVSHRYHAAPHLHLSTWLGVYLSATPGVWGGDNGTLRLDLDNEPQPDNYLCLPEKMGSAVLEDDGYVAGSPELVCEVAASSASYDLHEKLNAYRRNGVREYLVWRTFDAQIDWFILRGSKFEKLIPSESGLLQSEMFHGLLLDPRALINSQLSEVLRVLQVGIASPEHAQFLADVSKCLSEI